MRKLIFLLTLVCALLAFSSIAYADGTTTLTLKVPDSENFADNQAVKVKLAYTGKFKSETTETTLPVSVQFNSINSAGSHVFADIGVHADNTIMFMNKGTGKVNETGTITTKSNPYDQMTLDHLLLFINDSMWNDNPLDPGTYTMGITFTSEIVTQ